MKPTIRDVPYRLLAKQRLLLDVYLPEDDYPPVILFLHGGGFTSCDRTCIDGRLFTALLDAGYAIVSTDYRLAPHVPFSAIYDDCLYASQWIRSNLADADLNTDQLGVWGISAGGHLASLLGVQGMVEAVCSHYGSSDFLSLSLYQKQLSAFFNQDNDQNQARDYSPFYHIQADTAPFFIVHGEKDTLIPPEQSIKLHRALRNQGKESDLLLLEDSAHEIPDHHIKPVSERMIRFFDRHLR